MALSAVSTLCPSVPSTVRRYLKHNALVYACPARNAETRVLSAVAVEEVESTLPAGSGLGVDRCWLPGTHSGVSCP